MITFAFIMASAIYDGDPKTYQEAITRWDANKWNDSMKVEMNSLNNNNTWVLVPKPQGVKNVAYRWLNKRKEGIPNIEEPRYKFRLVARVFYQRKEVFSYVVKYISIRILLSIVVNDDMELEQLDVKIAFLHGI